MSEIGPTRTSRGVRACRLLGESGRLPKVKSIKPPPWSVKEMAAWFHLRDSGGQKLAYVYFEEEPGGAQRQSY